MANVPLLRPFTCFEDPPDWVLRPAVVVGLPHVTAVALALLVYGLGSVVAGELAGVTVTVDNPAYPGDQFCELSGSDGFEPSGCDEPATLERDAAAMIRDATAEVAATSAVGFFVSWLLGGAVLHATAWIASGEGDLADSYAISSWSGLALALAALPGVGYLAYRIRARGIDGGDAEAIATSVEAVAAGAEPVLLAIGVLGVSWQATLWFGGLVGLHRIDEGPALAITAVLWAVSLLGTL